MLTATQVQLEKKTLANGSLFLFNPMEGAPRIAMYFLLPGGNTLDTVPGIVDISDRLVMKGTEKRNQEQLSIELDGLTLDLDVDTKRDFSLISATFLEEDLDASFELISDIFYNATFVEFEREKQKIIGELQMELDSPKARASDLFIRTIFENTAYGTTSSVFLEQIEKIKDVKDALAHYHQVYQPERMIISVAGDIAPSRIAEKIERYFPQKAETPSLKAPKALQTTKALRAYELTESQYVTFPRDDSTQAHIYKGWLAPAIDNPDHYPMAVLNTLLGAAGLSSRLFLELRDKQGLAYNVRSSYEAYKYQGLFYIYIGTEPSNKDKCLQGFIDECQKLMDTPVSERELAETKENILGRRTVYLETATQQAGYVGSNFVMGREIEDIEQLNQRINAVTADDIQRVAKTYLTRPSVISVVGPSAIL